MHFKLVHFIKKLGITFAPDDKLTFEFDDARKTSVMLRPLTESEKDKYKKSDLIYCEAKFSQEIPDKINEMLNRLKNYQMPEGFKKPKPKTPFEPDVYPYVDEKGQIRKKNVPSVFLYPKEFQDFEKKIHTELSDFIEKTVKTIRWKLSSNSSHNPIAFVRGLSWSINGRKWRSMPHDIKVLFKFEIENRIYGKVYDEIKGLIKNQEFEPLGHELFLEAWEQRGINPRSALVLGIVAAEVGFKQCIAKLVPNAQWLADNSPSPPLAKMVTSYLPLLPAKLKIQGKVLAPPKSVRKAIQDGVELRNKTTHVGNSAPQQDVLEELLLSIRDLLYLLDFYCGYEWALDNIRIETAQAMKQEYNL